MRKPVPKAIPNTFHFTDSDFKKFKLPSLLKNVHVKNWNNIPELLDIARNSRRSIPKECKLRAWINAFKRVEIVYVPSRAVASFAGKMAEYLGNEVGQEEFTAELHKREMAMLERRAAQINERLKMILRIEQLQVLEKELKDKIDKTENMTEESTTSEDDANSDSTAE